MLLLFLTMQYGRIVDIDLKIPPRPPGYAFIEVFFLFFIKQLIEENVLMPNY